MKKPVGERGLLAGLPLPIKDLADVAGVRTTHGSPIYKDHVPVRSDSLVEHLECTAASSSANPTRRNSAPAPTPLTKSSRIRCKPWNMRVGRRLLRRFGGRARHRPGLACAWLRSGRLAAHAGELLRRRRLAAQPRPRGDARSPSPARCVQGPMARNVDDCADAGCHVRRAPATRCRCRRCRPRFCPRRAPAGAEAGCLFARFRHLPGRSGGARSPARPQRFRGSRRHRRGSASRYE